MTFLSHKLNYCVIVWFRKFICFFKKWHHIAKTAWCWVPRDPRSIFLATTFAGIISRSSDSMYFSYFMLENIWQDHLPEVDENSQEIVNFVPIVGPLVPELNWNKFTISWEFGPVQVKWYHLFSGIKMEEYMEPELSDIIFKKMVVKNVVFGSPGNHFMLMRVKAIIYLLLYNLHDCTFTKHTFYLPLLSKVGK